MGINLKRLRGRQGRRNLKDWRKDYESKSKETGEIVDVQECAVDMYLEEIGEMSGRVFHIQELDFDNLDYPDYWTKLEHQYAGMAMQGLVTRGEVLGATKQEIAIEIADISDIIAHALVEKMKEAK